jgi:hypothetical protein
MKTGAVRSQNKKMGIANSTPISAPDTLPPFNPIPQGKTRICVVAFKSFNFVAGHGAFKLSGRIANTFPDKYETWYYTPASAGFYDFLKVIRIHFIPTQSVLTYRGG